MVVLTSAVADALQFRRVASESSAWSLLRSPNAPTITAILRTVFSGQRRSVMGAEFVEELKPILVELREEGFELPRSATRYINDWVKAGLLIRRSPQGANDEFYELSADAITAIGFIATLQTPRPAATRARLHTMIECLDNLATDTDPDEAQVLVQLEREKAEIEQRIELVRERGVDVISQEEAVEQAENILSLVAEIPGDFARVQQATEELNQNLRAQILTDELSAGEVLDNVFRGVDVIQDSDEARSFNGFYELLSDRKLSARLESTLESVLSRPFVGELPAEKRAQLRWLLRNLEDHSAAVHDSTTAIARSLRRFVQSREVESQQALASAIAHAQTVALQLGQCTNPSEKIGVELELTSRTLSSAASWVLYDPADFRIERNMEIAKAGVADLAELQARVRESEIDWIELQDNIVSVLEAETTATVGQVLELRPATQGLASVVGVLKLAMQYGERTAGTEYVVWETRAGGKKKAKLLRYRFTPNSLDVLGKKRPTVRLVSARKGS